MSDVRDFRMPGLKWGPFGPLGLPIALIFFFLPGTTEINIHIRNIHNLFYNILLFKHMQT